MVDRDKNIFSKYRVLFIMVPGIVLIHVLWLKLQTNPDLIRDSDREKSRLPALVVRFQAVILCAFFLSECSLDWDIIPSSNSNCIVDSVYGTMKAGICECYKMDRILAE